MVGRVDDPGLDWLDPEPTLKIDWILIDPTDPTFELNLYDPQVVPDPANQYIYLRGTNTCNKHITYKSGQSDQTNPYPYDQTLDRQD